MANTTLASSMGSQDHQIFSEDIANSCASLTPNTENSNNDANNAKRLEDLQCFVCDASIQGRHYTLATCRTQTSRSRVIEKLGELVGERYMVVISEDDMICRSCANLINTLDRLEVEMRNVRDNVLRFLEQKYSLKEGELLGSSEESKRSQPPQITKCSNQNNSQSEKGDNPSYTGIKSRSRKSNIWMQCDKCQYTTHHNSFMVHHIRDHIKQKLFCDKCGTQFHKNKSRPHDCKRREQSEQSTANETSVDPAVLERTMRQYVPIMSKPSYPESQISEDSSNMPVIQLSNSESSNMQDVLTSDNTSSGNPPMFVRLLQSVDVNEDSMQPTMMATSDTELMAKIKDNLAKQILTMTDDGNLEMVEVSCWNDMQSSDSQSNITFQ